MIHLLAFQQVLNISLFVTKVPGIELLSMLIHTFETKALNGFPFSKRL
jgi:hypothetical protein